VLAVAFGLGVQAEPQFRRGDFRTYYCYLRSLAFDHDLDFTNDYEGWGLEPPPLTPTGHRRNVGTPGPALVWSPFFVLAHVYVIVDRAAGAARYEADGNSAPYLRSALAGTVAIAVVGAWLLALVLERRVPRGIAALAVLATVLTSPLLVYVFAEPGMSHGATFGAACIGIWAADRARRDPSTGAWLVAGAVAGFLVLLRLQAAVFSLLFLCVAVEGLARKTVRPGRLVAAGAVAALVVSPQLVVWKVLYGRWLPSAGGLSGWSETVGRRADVLFQPTRWLDLSSPRLMDVLFSADRGLFAWTPGLLLAFAGLVLGLRRWGLLGVGGVLVLAATAWFNGSYAFSWAAGDAFGARRFDVVVPFAALGYGSVLAFLAGRPLLAPAVLVLALSLWNLGLAHLWRVAVVPEAAALETVASLQAAQLRRWAVSYSYRVLGPGAGALAYGSLVGEYFFWNTTRDGVIDVGSPDQPFLTGSWSEARNEAGPPSFRIASAPRACARMPLLEAVDLTARITARAATRHDVEPMTVTLNGVPLARSALGPGWTETVAALPRSLLRRGENLLCLEFEAGEPGGGRAAARVQRIVVH
jgi:hypothetical protein